MHDSLYKIKLNEIDEGLARNGLESFEIDDQNALKSEKFDIRGILCAALCNLLWSVCPALIFIVHRETGIEPYEMVYWKSIYMTV